MSPRPKKTRRCQGQFCGKAFKPTGTSLPELKHIILYRDELEALRLCDFEGLFQGYQAFAQGEANAARANANELERTEQFNRRAQDWAHAEQQARLELAQVDALLHTQAEQEKATRLHLRSAQTALAQAQSTYQLLSTRTARAQLYEWLNTQLGTFYYALHDSAQSLCLAAEACWQYETAEQRTFFSTDSWRQAHHGLLSAEALKLNLLRMNAAYLQHTPRELEISKTVSLCYRLIECGVMVPQISPNTLPTKTWADHKAALVQHGTLCFELTRALFDEDYPGHTLRRIKQVSLSLPGTLGPYEDIKATLTQTRNEVDSAGARAFSQGFGQGVCGEGLDVFLGGGVALVHHRVAGALQGVCHFLHGVGGASQTMEQDDALRVLGFHCCALGIQQGRFPSPCPSPARERELSIKVWLQPSSLE